jgi:hypothetical protein
MVSWNDAEIVRLKTLRDAVLEAIADGLVDCGDNSCRFAPRARRGGLRTNGGCRCFHPESETGRTLVRVLLEEMRSWNDATSRDTREVKEAQ